MSNTNSDISPVIFARQVQAHTLHHKIVVFIIAIVLLIAWGTLHGAYNNYINIKDSYNTSVKDHNEKITQQQNILKEVELLTSVNSATQKAVLIQCYNTNCQTLPEGLRSDPMKTIFKQYLQLQQANDNRFTIDQKKVLAYLNDFLVRGVNGGVNAQIKQITFSTPKGTTLDTLIAIPMSVVVTFPDKGGLLGFLRNIESLISPAYPMLAKVDSVSYDIVKAASAQDVQIAMTLYMIKDATVQSTK